MNHFHLVQNQPESNMLRKISGVVGGVVTWFPNRRCRQSHTGRGVDRLFARVSRDNVYTGNVDRPPLQWGHFLAVRGLPCRMDHQPQPACEETSCRPLGCHSPPVFTL